MEQVRFGEAAKFKTPQEELAFLREQIALKEKQLENIGEHVEKQKVASQKLEQYKNTPAENVLKSDYVLPQNKAEGIVLNLAPEPHDNKMAELLGMVEQYGIRNTLAIVEKMNDPHVEDDFHRFLVQYVKSGHSVKGINATEDIRKSLAMTLYEIALPQNSDTDDKQSNTQNNRGLKEMISSMEQFYSGMLSLSTEKEHNNYFALEIANANHSEEFIFYVAIPDNHKQLFEKQVLSIFPTAKIAERTDDYNVFNESGASVGAYLTQSKNHIFPIKTYDKFDYDPLNVVLSGFSKINKNGEGAAIQIVFSPASEDEYLKKYKKSLTKIEKGEPVKKAIKHDGAFVGFVKDVAKAFETKDDKKDKKESVVDQIAVENIREKLNAPVAKCNIRIVASAENDLVANKIMHDIQSSFNQFENTNGNKFVWKEVPRRSLQHFFRDFSFRTFSKDIVMPLNLKEVSSIIHFQTSGVESAPQLRQSKAKTAPVPPDMPESGTLLGVNKDRSFGTKVYMTPEDRLRHFYVIGQTGTGKSTLLKNMIIQDIHAGNGVCMIDPHGVDIIDVLANIPANRRADVIYFDPSSLDRPMGLNMLEYDLNHPEQKTFVVNELFSIFQKLYGAVPESMGPMFEQYFRNATMLVIEDPESGNTLLDVSRVMANKEFRDLKISRCKNPVVVQFWNEIASKAGGEASLANIVPYITSKFDVFLANEIMRPIIAQEKSSFNFRDMLDNKKIFLVNLAKGRLGDINANLLGLILVGKILMAALSRVDSIGKDLPPFYLYIDEFQNVTTDSVATIFSEARKYKLSLNVANQFIAQLEENIRDSVFGNVGSIGAFRVGADDAEYLEKQFAPIFTASDLMNIDNRNAYLKMLVNGKPTKAFSIETLPPPIGDMTTIEDMKKLSYLTYGRNRADVEKSISQKYRSMGKSM